MNVDNDDLPLINNQSMTTMTPVTSLTPYQKLEREKARQNANNVAENVNDSVEMSDLSPNDLSSEEKEDEEKIIDTKLDAMSEDERDLMFASPRQSAINPQNREDNEVFEQHGDINFGGTPFYNQDGTPFHNVFDDVKVDLEAGSKRLKSKYEEFTQELNKLTGSRDTINLVSCLS